MHWSLTPKANARFIGLWLIVGMVLLVLLPPRARIGFGFGGASLGTVAGWLQLRSMREAAGALLAAADALAVRRALASNKWGKRYFVLFWASQVAMIVAGFAVLGLRGPAGALLAYCAFGATREAVTLAGARELARAALRPVHPEA